MHRKKRESVLHWSGGVHDNVAKAVPKIAHANPQDLAVSVVFHGLHDHDVVRMTSIQAKGEVASALPLFRPHLCLFYLAKLK